MQEYILFISLNTIPDFISLKKNENFPLNKMATQQIGPIIAALPTAFSTAYDVVMSTKDYLESGIKSKQELQDWYSIVVKKDSINIPIIELINVRNHKTDNVPILFNPGVCGWVNLMHVLGYDGINGLHTDICRMLSLGDGRYINKVNGHLATYIQHSAIIELTAKFGAVDNWLNDDFASRNRYPTTLGTFTIGLNNSGSIIVYFNRGKGDNTTVKENEMNYKAIDKGWNSKDHIPYYSEEEFDEYYLNKIDDSIIMMKNCKLVMSTNVIDSYYKLIFNAILKLIPILDELEANTTNRDILYGFATTTLQNIHSPGCSYDSDALSNYTLYQWAIDKFRKYCIDKTDILPDNVNEENKKLFINTIKVIVYWPNVKKCPKWTTKLESDYSDYIQLV